MSVEENIIAIGNNNKLIGRLEALNWVLDHLAEGIDGEYLEYCIINHQQGLLAEWEQDNDLDSDHNG